HRSLRSINDCVRYFFILSSRRRHTRSNRDGSSDVCASDLELAGIGLEKRHVVNGQEKTVADLLLAGPQAAHLAGDGVPHVREKEIGRASCRETVEGSVTARSRDRAPCHGERTAVAGKERTQ